jgi:hypothetical protein
MAEDTQTPQDDAANFAKVQEFIQTQVKDYLTDMQEQAQRSNPQVIQTEQQRAQQQLRETLNPFIEPGLNEVKLETANTRDMFQFYRDNPQIADEEKNAVEKMFAELKDKGRAIPRQDIYDYLEGKAARENPDNFTKKISERKQRQLDRAQSAVDMGAQGLHRRDDPLHPENFKALSVEEMEKAMDGWTF